LPRIFAISSRESPEKIGILRIVSARCSMKRQR
jgi:hypothetical protein